MTLQGFDEALFAELFVCGVVGFGDAIGVEGEGVAWAKLAFSNFAIPILENAQDGGGGFEALDGAIAVEEKSGEMAAIGVTQVAWGGDVPGGEKGCERNVGRVVEKDRVHGGHQARQRIESDAARA